MIRLFSLLIALALGAGAATAQDRAQSLADIRQELVILNTAVQGLRAELNTTGLPTDPGLAGATTIERIDAIEAELRRLTSKTEELEFRINQVVADGTNRIGDLEFRLVELEGGDVGALGQASTLGGGTAPAVAATAPAGAATTGGAASGGAELAVSEQADFDRAKEALDSGSFRSAADLFATFAQTYTGGPLTAEAHFLRGDALSQLGDTAAAARAYLEAFSGAPSGPRAPEALTRLGQSLGTLGQTNEACVTLGEVPARYPGTVAASEAEAAMLSLGCS